MHEIVCIDETFDPNFTNEYKLSIQVGLDGFSFSVLDDIRKKYLVFQHYPLRFKNLDSLARKVEDIIKNNDLLQKEYKNVKVLFKSHRCILVPKGEIAAEQYENLLKINFETQVETSVASFDIENFNVICVYYLPQKLNNLLQENYSVCSITHQLEPIIKSEVTYKSKQPVVSITVNKHYFTVLIYQGKEVLFFNSFDYQNDHDFVYFLLSAVTTVGLNPKELLVQLNGQIEKESTLIKLLSDYFIFINFRELNKQFHYSYTFASVKGYQFLSVINSEG